LKPKVGRKSKGAVKTGDKPGKPITGKGHLFGPSRAGKTCGGVATKPEGRTRKGKTGGIAARQFRIKAVNLGTGPGVDPSVGGGPIHQNK